MNLFFKRTSFALIPIPQQPAYLYKHELLLVFLVEVLESNHFNQIPLFGTQVKDKLPFLFRLLQPE